MAKQQVIAVIVAYNRADLLVECLAALAAQTRKLDQVLVVDNASSDNSLAIAQAHPVVTKVLPLAHNTGGAGGFTAGIAYALSEMGASDHDWLWIMDDDTVPTVSALEKLLAAQDAYPGQPALLASKAVWTDGQTHPMNTHRQRPLLNRKQVAAAHQIETIPVRAASFVSILIEVAQIKASGLPIADYFIWNDDLEYTARLLKYRVGLYVPNSVVVHKTKARLGATDDPGDRFFYEVRNKIWFLTRSSGLHLQDRILYGGSMLVRWTKMLVGSKQRTKLLRLAGQGIKAAISAGPRPNPDLFSNHVELEKQIRKLENIG